MVSSSEPWSASITVPDGIWCAPVSVMNCPLLVRMNTVPATGLTSSLLPRTGRWGAAVAAAVNVWSGPCVVPAALIATSRKWYSAPGISPVSDAVTL